ncbi:S46 family peptidase [Acetobacter persici]|uniref:Dipeptidyl-peptidase n=1 Tax=Acetobacter persici TaxID=1076596 RepID=A0A6V8I3S1_9PROT|nr:S46 family peptidase [Acetobacter persici]OUI91969.1 peptidase S46 [Acetobacter persici]GFE92180.1 dipeptidyl-peptidase [Acetobacter persici]
MSSFFKRSLLPLAVLACAPAVLPAIPFAHADEGMWTMDHLPVELMKQRYGFTPTPAWTERVTKASARLALGCSASFVSADGLVMTNHHCANECLQQLSGKGKNYFQDGYSAKSPADEQRCPAMELNQLDSITDVTERMQTALRGKDGAAYTTARQAEESAIEKDCAKDDPTKWRCDVISLYHGGRTALYRYRRYQDVRMVMAPDQNAAFFGGDPDNFNFPRYDLDMAFLRVYENGKPAKVDAFLPFDAAGPKEGELVFTSGNPGSTEREVPLADLEFSRNVTVPFIVDNYSALDGALWQYSRESAAHHQEAQERIFGIENSLKVYRGRVDVLADPKLLDAKAKSEASLRDWINADPKRKEAYGDPWAKNAEALAVKKRIFKPYVMLEGSFGIQGELFQYAKLLVRAANERQKPDAERLTAYHDARLPALEAELGSTAPVYPDLEKTELAFSLSKLRQVLGADDDMVKLVLGKASPDDLAETLVKGTKLADPKVRLALWKGGADAVAASKDPMIVLARSLEPHTRALRKQMDDDVAAPSRQATEAMAKARFERDGVSSYPDATFTQRLSFGQVKGWDENGKAVPAFTYFSGLYDRATGSDPFKLTKPWLDAKAHVNMKTPYDFVSTNDIIGGNSGSPVINSEGHAVGLIFDGNIHSLGGDFYYDESTNRAVAVDTAAIMEALKVVYKNQALAKELSQGHL